MQELLFSGCGRSRTPLARNPVMPGFDASVARAIGEIALNLAIRRALAISMCISSPDRTLFYCALDGTDPNDETILHSRIRSAFAQADRWLKVSEAPVSGTAVSVERTSDIHNGLVPLIGPDRKLKAIAGATGRDDHLVNALMTEALDWHLHAIGMDRIPHLLAPVPRPMRRPPIEESLRDAQS